MEIYADEDEFIYSSIQTEQLLCFTRLVLSNLNWSCKALLFYFIFRMSCIALFWAQISSPKGLWRWREKRDPSSLSDTSSMSGHRRTGNRGLIWRRTDRIGNRSRQPSSQFPFLCLLPTSQPPIQEPKMVFWLPSSSPSMSLLVCDSAFSLLHCSFSSFPPADGWTLKLKVVYWIKGHSSTWWGFILPSLLGFFILIGLNFFLFWEWLNNVCPQDDCLFSFLFPL